MPRKKVMPAVRREWLKEYEDGKSPQAIATRHHLDPRTVKKHLEAAQRERYQRDAMGALMRNALDRHHADLVAVLKLIGRQVPVPPDSRPANLEYEAQMAEATPQTYRLLQALRKEHMPGAALWRALKRWQDLGESYFIARRQGREKETEAIFRKWWDQAQIVHRELDTIILRRVVPGRCRYCPV